MYDALPIVVTDRDLSTVDPRRLPPVLRKMVKLLGVGEALKLACRFGGRRVYIGRTAAFRRRLARHLAPESLAILCQQFAGDSIDMPKPDRILIQIRNDQIRRLRAEGASLNELCAEFQLSRRQVMNACSDKRT